MNALFFDPSLPSELAPSRATDSVAVYPFYTPTLLPAITTNTVVIEGDHLLVVDPATPHQNERERFDAMLRHYAAQGKTLSALILTHHHADHVGDAERVSQALGVPIWAHRETASRVEMKVARLLEDGDLIGGTPEISKQFRILHTPGHAPGHICLFDEARGALIAGDMVANGSPIFIDPFDGNLATYLGSLDRLLALSLNVVVPSHGAIMTPGRAQLEQTRQHRIDRAEQVFAHVPLGKENATSPDALLIEIYVGQVAPSSLPFALMSLMSTLQFLVERNRIQCDSDSQNFWRSR